ncbi:aspartate aminotransferase family protein [Lysinibacillus mangiferihumi]|uniref:Aspartate aminotransferase family protein n=1 Tax=Lysinibacillus mangiferihumi TaxID=1130819 RepID=A0A4U2YGV2_9BACI|nr:aspartate aminotransferase family protein [Lysinibacillus mangiferihumi]TKI60060.1 aspartate aminotransferase family protein [Lysinibacillus mangiferihumi]
MTKKKIIDIVSNLESPSTSEIISNDTKLDWEKGLNFCVWTEEGTEYIDLTAGSGVHNVGYNNSKVNEEIIKQLQSLSHTGWQFPTRSRATLLEKLCNILPFKNPKFIFTVTGSEAVEAALKLSRLVKGKSAVLSFQGGFHGKTGGSLAVTANPKLRDKVTNYAADIIRLPFPEDDALRRHGYNVPSVDEYLKWIKRFILHPDFPLDQVAGIIVEPIQGSSGMTAAPPNFLKALRKLTSDEDMLLIMDEIYTGFGRTGKMFGFQHDDIIPDIVIMGKSLGGGLPISVVAAPSDLMNKMPAYKQTSTFSGHPVACAAGSKVLEIIVDDNLSQNALERGEQFRERLEEINTLLLKESKIHFVVTGKGLMLGLHIEADTSADSERIARVLNDCLKEQFVICLLGGTFNNVIKITPPLTLTPDDVDMICDRFILAVKKMLYLESIS